MRRMSLVVINAMIASLVAAVAATKKSNVVVSSSSSSSLLLLSSSSSEQRSEKAAARRLAFVSTSPVHFFHYRHRSSSKVYDHHRGSDDTEGFRDAIRRDGGGGRAHNIKDESVVSFGTITIPGNEQRRNVNSATKQPPSVVGEVVSLSSPSPISSSSPMSSTTIKETNNIIPFPKLTPGRKRNYHPPHVLSAIRRREEYVKNYIADESREGDDETTNFIENFRDGKRHMMEMESLQIIRSGTSTSYDNNNGMFESPKKTSSSEGANLRRVLLPQKQGQQHVGTMVDRKHGNVNDTEEEEYENDEYEDDIDGDTVSINNSELTVGKKKTTWSTTLLSTSGGEGVGSDSERFRDDLRSSSRGSGHSGSDVNVVNRGLINGGGGGGGGTNNGKNKKSFGLGNNLVVVGSPPLPLPSKSILTSHYSSSSTVSDKFGRGNDKVVGNKSMNFRDGNTRLATYYKDEAFSSRLVGDDNSNAIFKDEEEEEEEKYKGGVEEENDIDGRYDQANTGPYTRTSTASGLSSSSSSSSSNLLLSIDPRSIDIIPLSKGRAVEGSETSKVAAAASTTTDAVDRSNIIPDPFSSEMLFHPHGESGHS